MKKYFLFTCLLCLISAHKAQTLLVIANPIPHNGYLTAKVNKYDLCCEIKPNELNNANSDFGLEICRMLPIWRKYYTRVDTVFWHNTKQPYNFESLCSKAAQYDNILFLDHYSKEKLFGLNYADFEILLNSCNTAFLGICNGSQIAKDLNVAANVYYKDSKYLGGNKSAKNKIGVLGF